MWYELAFCTHVIYIYFGIFFFIGWVFPPKWITHTYTNAQNAISKIFGFIRYYLPEPLVWLLFINARQQTKFETKKKERIPQNMKIPNAWLLISVVLWTIWLCGCFVELIACVAFYIYIYSFMAIKIGFHG